jgi:hypothetical protein
MARKPTVLDPVTDQPAPSLEDQVAALKRKVDFLWNMVVFLEDHVYYKVGDYMMERADEVAAITQEG